MGSERSHVDKYLCTVCGHRHSNGWYCKHSIDAKDAEIERLKTQLSTAQMSAIEHQAKYVTMHERHQGLWRENLDLKAQLTGSDKLIETLCEQARLAVEKETLLNAQLSATEQQAGNVLARIHGDGGHYITQHGWEKACVDADAVVCRLQAQLSASEEKRKVLGAEVRKARAILGPFGTLRDGIIQEDGLMYEDARRATDAASALEAP